MYSCLEGEYSMLTVVVISGLIILDQLSKLWAMSTLSSGRDILLWQNVFHLTYIENRGAAFGMLQGKQWFLMSVTLIVIIAISMYFKKLPNTRWGSWAKFSFILIISGAIGNFIDRLFLNYVRDFLYFSLIDFPVFNFADILVVVGVGILLVVILRGDIESCLENEE